MPPASRTTARPDARPSTAPPPAVPATARAAEHVRCDACDAVCCRLTVVVQPEDRIARHLTEWRDGLHVMARDPEGWCVALDSARMCCSIYDARPDVCRRFAMGGDGCRTVRADYARGYPESPEETT
jgi:Fe-S-cluster containining protein